MSILDYLDEDDKKDCERIQRIARERGFPMSIAMAGLIWADHSEDWCASWLYLDDSDDEIWRYVKEYQHDS